MSASFRPASLEAKERFSQAYRVRLPRPPSLLRQLLQQPVQRARRRLPPPPRRRRHQGGRAPGFDLPRSRHAAIPHAAGFELCRRASDDWPLQALHRERRPYPVRLVRTLPYTLANGVCDSSSTEWNLIFALFSATLQQEEAAKLSFDLMRRLASGQLGTGLREDNYASFLQVLAGFANVAATNAKSAERARWASHPFSSKEVPALMGLSRSDDPAMQRGRQIVDILRDTQAAIPELIASSPLSAPRGTSFHWLGLLNRADSFSGSVGRLVDPSSFRLRPTLPQPLPRAPSNRHRQPPTHPPRPRDSHERGR